MKNIIALSLVSLVFSCKKQAVTEDNSTSKPEQTIKIVQKIQPESLKQQEDKNLFKILVPGSYRYWNGENDAKSLNKKWISLHKSNNKFFLDRAEYEVSAGYDECIGDSTIVVQSKLSTLLFLENSKLKLGEIKSVQFNKNKIWPGETFNFKFNGEAYTLRAEGTVLTSQTVLTDEGEEIFKDVENYRLYLSDKNGNEQLFLRETSFNDTFVELEFIGDLDRDDKPDFIFRASRDYEEERLLLYLSGNSAKNELIKKVSEISRQFDC